MLLVKEAWCTLDLTASCRDLYFVLSPITWICRIAGIFPLTLEGPVGKRKYSTSYVLIIYSLTGLVLSGTGLYASTDHTNERHMKISEDPVVQISINFEMVLEIISMVIMVVTAILSKDKFANAIESLTLQDISLQKLGIKVDYAADSKQHYTQLGIIVLIIFMFCISDFVYQLDFNMKNPLNWISWMCPVLIRFASACLFVDVVVVLKKRFGALNEHLRKLIEQTKGSPPVMISTRCKMCETIRSIATIHGALCEAALTVNQTFSYTIIAGIIYTLVVLTISLYHIFQEIKMPNPNYVMMLGTINWIIMASGHIVYIVVACHFAQDQANLTGKLIHKFQISAVDTPLNNVIQSFSLQLHHEKIEFSGAGFFPLDATLIQSIVGAVTTYLVILIQINP